MLKGCVTLALVVVVNFQDHSSVKGVLAICFTMILLVLTLQPLVYPGDCKLIAMCHACVGIATLAYGLGSSIASIWLVRICCIAPVAWVAQQAYNPDSEV